LEVVVTSLGMVSSVGRDVVTACAAMRAGIVRAQPLTYFQALDETSQEMEPITGHPVRALTEGFTIIGRWLGLARGCVSDLLRQGALPDASDVAFWRSTGVLAVTPYHDDDRFGGEASDDAPPSTEPVRLAYLQPLLEGLGLPIDERNAEVLCLGAAGAVHAIHQASRWMADRGLERLLVIAVDSYCDPLTLEWLLQYRRLKTPEHPQGLMPGEAGACFLLESAASARRRQPPMQLAIVSAAVRMEKDHFFTRKPNLGVALAEALEEVLAGAALKAPFAGSLVSDLNGENWRANEWGYARLRLGQKLAEGLHLVLPATSVGDTGAASGAVGLCVAARALVRGYARAEHVVTVSSSERGQVGAVCLKLKG
jgi:3-oxoacyl-[acyl-carrier-protein] synthase-1